MIAEEKLQSMVLRVLSNNLKSGHMLDVRSANYTSSTEACVF